MTEVHFIVLFSFLKRFQFQEFAWKTEREIILQQSDLIFFLISKDWKWLWTIKLVM